MVVDRLYSATVAERFSDIKLILGCGDLPYEYLEFLVTALQVPLLYVPGNHDPVYNPKDPCTFAQGGDNLDLKVTRSKGLTIAGIGGSMRYQPSKGNQYTETKMLARLAAFSPKLFWYLYRKGGRLDILIAHSPPKGVHDDNDLAHTGFSAFHDFIKFFEPRFFLHGHTLAYRDNIAPPATTLGHTAIINVNPYRIIEV
jgi:Icc-related predicted phosphoesterase